jgi:signal transduction histidine kinase/ligand-binding sensor domain-containing protein/DNA-binding response OmpR family regulator
MTGNFPIKTLIITAWATMFMVACNKDVAQQQHDKDEEHAIVVAQELSNSRVQCITEDATGQLWIGTFRGLNRYDGHEYHHYFCSYDSLGLTDNQVKDILCDHQGRLWVATVNGVCRYNRLDRFDHIRCNTSNLNTQKLLEDSKGQIYVYNGNELLRYDEKKQVFIPCITRQMAKQQWGWGNCIIDASDRILITESQRLLLYDNTSFKLVKEIPLDDNRYYFYSEMLSNGLMILSGYGYMTIYDTKSQRIVPVDEAMDARITAHNSIVQAARLLEDNTILLSTSHNGIFELNLLSHTLHGEGDTGFTIPVPDALVTQIFQDSRKNVWFGTYDKGLFADYYYKEKFGGSDNYLNRVIDNSSVLAVAMDHEQNLWISTLLKGLFVYHCDTQKAESVPLQGLPTGEQKNAVTHIFCDRDGYLWFSAGSIVLKCRYDQQRLVILSQASVPGAMDFEQTDDGTVWVSTSSNDIMGFPLDASQPIVKQAFNADFCFIPSLLKLNDGQMLISAFFQKILRMNPQTGKFSELDIPSMAQCIRRSVYIPTDMIQDSNGDVWIGTVTNGLLRYNLKTNEMTRIGGLSCSDVGSIEEDRQGNLWISTMKGLNRWDRKTGRITSLYKVDGIGGDEFADRASCQLPNGSLVFGSTDGITMFNPVDIDTLLQLPIRFCDLKIHNQLVRPSVDGPIEAMLDSCQQIRLSHSENSFSISFTALDFGEYERVHYYYKMDGFDRDWIDAGNTHAASYANLPSGSYTFRVKATDDASDEMISDERTLKVVVEPAPAYSWWAWLIYLAIASALAYYLYRNARRVVIARRAARQAQMEKEQELRTNQMNMSFFANIAHEFRTPLTMIAGPVGQLVKSDTLSGEDKGLLSIAQRSIQRMFKLVNQLMDFNKLENDTLRLNVEEIDVVKALNDICDTFEFNAQEKGITIYRIGMDEPLMAWTDGDKLEKIISNLLSNALKFTPRSGRIDVSLDMTNDKVKVSVADTGKGIPEEQKENIFKRYYQLDNQTKAIVNWGTGIGLYFARRLAELHHGSLMVDNRTEGTGAVFTFDWPINAEAYTNEERRPLEKGVQELQEFRSSDDSSATPQAQNVTSVTPATPELLNSSESEDARPTILVVDDDTEIINYMRLLFSQDYRLITCLDAESALDEMRAEEPNLVLSDVAMPGKDGYELCQEIKQDIQLSHIPVILVTAKVTAENQVEGLNVGADAYVTKPFEPAVLSALIQSQLKNRERIRKLLTSNTNSQLEDAQLEDALSEQDKHFMEELYKLMEEELSNSELDVTRITKLLFISRTKLYYKIKGLTGETPSNFFRTYKLNRAAELLKSGRYTIAEIADKTGFSTQSHFTVVFKKQFGVTPSEYR